MSWLRRLSRDRSISKGDSSPSMPSANRPGSFHTNEQQSSQGLYKDTQYSSTHNSQDKLLNNNASNSYSNHRGSAPSSSHDHHHHHHHNSISQFNSQPALNNQSQRPPGTSTSDAMTMHTAQGILAVAPEPLTKAFNEALKPYADQIETLKNEVEDLTLQLQQLEDERADMHAWIDKRGLRAGNASLPSLFIPRHVVLSLYNWGGGFFFSLFFSLTNLLFSRCSSLHSSSNEHRPFCRPNLELPH